MMLRFYLLGELRIVQGDEPLPAPPFRLHGLLAALLLRPRLQQRHYLVGLRFPDIPERAGRRRLSDQLYLLRKSLPVLPLVLTGEMATLPVESRWLDVEAFHRAAATDRPDDWFEALDLYQGDLRLQQAIEDLLSNLP